MKYQWMLLLKYIKYKCNKISEEKHKHFKELSDFILFKPDMELTS